MPNIRPSNLKELVEANRARSDWNIDLVIRGEIGGGKQSSSGLKSIEENPQATALTVSGLDQKMFERMVTTYGAQFSAIHFWKCPRIVDLTPLEQLPNLAHVAFFWNQRATRFWNFVRTPKLRGLQFEDFNQVHDLIDLCSASSLDELRFGSGFWVKAVFDSIEPLATLANLKSLNFDAKRIADGRIQPIAHLQQLCLLSFPSNLFTTEQLAWLRARLPGSLQSDSLEPIWKLEKPIDREDGMPPFDVLVVGKRKPCLNSVADAARIERYVDDFWQKVEEFRRNPELRPN